MVISSDNCNETSLAQPGAWGMLMMIPLVSSYQIYDIRLNEVKLLHRENYLCNIANSEILGPWEKRDTNS